MPIKTHAEDILSHIDSEATVAGKAVSLSGCVTILHVIEVCYSISGDAIKITAKLKTPLGDVELGSVTLDPQHTTAKLGGSLDGFKAEVTLTFDYSKLSLEICGKACAPIVGCTSGCTTIHV